MITYTLLKSLDSTVVRTVQKEIFKPDQAFPVKLIQDIISSNMSHACIIDGKMVGICLVGNIGTKCFIASLGVLDEYRRKNIANNLLTLTSKKAKYLHVETTNRGAMKLYEKHGFSYEAFIEDYYGSDRDAYLMKRYPPM